MKKQPKYPYGCCECTDCGPMNGCDGLGPAAFSVVRNGKSIRVCTRCDLPSDQNKKLLVTEKDNAKLWIDYDALGAFCIMGDLLERRNEKPKKKVRR